jgi:hypothetical protein
MQRATIGTDQQSTHPMLEEKLSKHIIRNLQGTGRKLALYIHIRGEMDIVVHAVEIAKEVIQVFCLFVCL